MEDFVILTDSCSDLDAALRSEFGVEYLPMRVLYEDKDLPADLDWGAIGFKEFYDLMRANIRVRTSQVNTPDYVEAFEKYVAAGKGVLSLSCSSALSSSYRGSLVARDEVLKKHPDAQIFCIDSRISSFGLGMLCILASRLRAEGKPLADVAAYIEENKQSVHQYGTVEDLVYLKRAGRVSAASAVFGGLLQVKPIIISNEKGDNVAVEKVKGRKNSFVRIADLVKEDYTASPCEEIFLGHADCEEDAARMQALLAERLPGVTVRVGKIGPIIGASCGPGMLAVYCCGKGVQG